MKKVIVRGPFLTRSGYGEHARFVLRALRANEELFDIYAVPIQWGQTSWEADDTDERRWFDFIATKTQSYINNGGQFDVSLQVTIPNEWQPMAPINIGVTAGIETTGISAKWVEKAVNMDKIIVTSEHARYGFENTTFSVKDSNTGQITNDFKCPTPVDVVGYPVKTVKPDKVNLDLKTDFNFLSIAQWGPRKNLENTITWFVEEFIDQPVGLVLKICRAKNNVYDRSLCDAMLGNLLRKYEGRKCSVYLLHGDMTEQELTSLYKNKKIKALVSLSHGEGFGLPLFEAAYNGLPVIAPDWSGHVDFLHMPVAKKGKAKGKAKDKAMFAKVDYSMGPIQEEAVWDGVLERNTMWCYAEQGSYKMRLREVYKDHGRFVKQAKQLQKYILKEMSEEKMYSKMVDCIMDVAGVSDQEDEEAVQVYG